MTVFQRPILLVLVGLVASSIAIELRAQGGWLSTPDQIEAFRQQVGVSDDP